MPLIKNTKQLPTSNKSIQSVLKESNYNHINRKEECEKRLA